MKIFRLFILLVIPFVTSAQEEDSIRMVDFVSSDGHFNLYYPNYFTVSETDSKGTKITSFWDSESGLEITISTYAESKKVKESHLKDLLGGFLEGKDVSGWNSYKTENFDNLIEAKVIDNGVHWIWYGISLGNKIVILSVNKKEDFFRSDLDLVRFMIDHLQIN